MNIRILLFFLFLKLNVSAQTDSIALLPPALLDDSLILKYKPSPREDIFISANRSPERPADLPFSTYIITSEEILRNGYVTLADVLKAAPGIRVSQPGSAIEGEKFLMNGLSGNRYVKILINDVPIKPSIQLGMPIAEQLPIRQADRIEIFYGAASVIYGGDACAGVVNIILKQSERPVFTQADLSFGRFGYNNLDLMFGGKVGKDKRIFRFSLFGSSTAREESNINLSEVNLMDNYLLFNENDRVFVKNPNYRPKLVTSTDNRPTIGQLKHDSRMFGIQLKWRGVDFMYLRTGRSMHTAVGQNPLAYSYANPSNRLTERTEIYSASFRTGRRWFKSQNIISFTNYRMENFSTAALVYDAPVAALSYFFPGDTADWKKRYDFNFKKYLSDDRYFYSNGFDLRHELRTSFLLGRKSSLDAGWQANLGGGYPLLNRLKMPAVATLFGDDNFQNTQPFSYYSDGDLDGNIFTQFNRRGKKLTLNFAAAANLSFIYGHDPLVNFRAAGLYKISSEWSVFANFSTGFRRPPIFYQSQSYIFQGDSIELAGSQLNEATERFYYNEFGIRYLGGSKNQVDFTFFRQRADFLVRNGYLIDSARNQYYGENYYGYANAPSEAMNLWGFRLSALSKTLDITANIDNRPVKIFWRNELFLQYARGEEFFGYGYQSIKSIVNLPRSMIQFRTAMRLWKYELVTSFNRQSASTSSAAFFTQFIPRQSAAKDIEGFTTWDFTFRFHLSQHFLFYAQLTNAFNRKYGGLDATGGPDDLIFNPQQLRQAKFGANYNLN